MLERLREAAALVRTPEESRQLDNAERLVRTVGRAAGNLEEGSRMRAAWQAARAESQARVVARDAGLEVPSRWRLYCRGRAVSRTTGRGALDLAVNNYRRRCRGDHPLEDIVLRFEREVDVPNQLLNVQRLGELQDVVRRSGPDARAADDYGRFRSAAAGAQMVQVFTALGVPAAELAVFAAVFEVGEEGIGDEPHVAAALARRLGEYAAADTAAVVPSFERALKVTKIGAHNERAVRGLEACQSQMRETLAALSAIEPRGQHWSDFVDALRQVPPAERDLVARLEFQLHAVEHHTVLVPDCERRQDEGAAASSESELRGVPEAVHVAFHAEIDAKIAELKAAMPEFHIRRRALNAASAKVRACEPDIERRFEAQFRAIHGAPSAIPTRTLARMGTGLVLLGARDARDVRRALHRGLKIQRQLCGDTFERNIRRFMPDASLAHDLVFRSTFQAVEQSRPGGRVPASEGSGAGAPDALSQAAARFGADPARVIDGLERARDSIFAVALGVQILELGGVASQPRLTAALTEILTANRRRFVHDPTELRAIAQQAIDHAARMEHPHRIMQVTWL